MCGSNFNFSPESDNDSDDIETINCPFCGYNCSSDLHDPYCKHVVFVVTENMINRFNTTTEMEDWLDKNIGDDICSTINNRKLATFCKKFGIIRKTLTEYGICCGPVCYEYIFGFKE